MKGQSPRDAGVPSSLSRRTACKPNIRTANGGLDANWIGASVSAIPASASGPGRTSRIRSMSGYDLNEYDKACALALRLATTAVMTAFARRLAFNGALACASIAIGCIYLAVSWRTTGPAYLRDEIGYLANAAFLMGYQDRRGERLPRGLLDPHRACLPALRPACHLEGGSRHQRDPVGREFRDDPCACCSAWCPALKHRTSW